MRDQGKSSSAIFPINPELPNNNAVSNPLPNLVYVPQCSRCSLAFLIVFVLLVTFALVLSILTMPPKPEIYITSMNLSRLNVSTGSRFAFSARWETGFLMRNTNKKTKLHYSGIRVSIKYGYAVFAETRMNKSFDQEKKSERTLMLGGYTVENTFEPSVGDKLAADLKKGIVKFDVKWYDWKHADGYSGFSVSCSDIGVSITSHTNGTMLGESKKCEVSTIRFFF